jgi:hypothetical protein
MLSIVPKMCSLIAKSKSILQIQKCLELLPMLCYDELLRNPSDFGEVAEWLKAQHWKCCLGVTLTRVRIPPSPFLSLYSLDRQSGEVSWGSLRQMRC